MYPSDLHKAVPMQVSILFLANSIKWSCRLVLTFQGKGRLVALCCQASLGQFKKLWKGKSEALKIWVDS